MLIVMFSFKYQYAYLSTFRHWRVLLKYFDITKTNRLIKGKNHIDNYKVNSYYK